MEAAAGSAGAPSPSADGAGPAPAADVYGKIESTVPGRTRLRLKPELRTPEAVAEVKQRLESHEDVRDVSVNPRTGSVVVVHATHRKGAAIAAEALRDTEVFAAALLDLPDGSDDAGGDRFGKLDQQLANLVYQIDYAVWRKTKLRFRGQLLVGAGAVYQAIASAQDGRAYPAPGRLLDVGGRRRRGYAVAGTRASPPGAAASAGAAAAAPGNGGSWDTRW